MARFLDDIRRIGRFSKPRYIREGDHEAEWKRYSTSMWDVLTDPELPVILIDNVAEFYFTGSDQEYWSLDKDFPNLAPPFRQFWMEHRMVKTINSRSEGITDVTKWVSDGRVGMLFFGMEPDQIKVKGDVPDKMRWLLSMELWIDYGWKKDHVPEGPHGMMYVPIDEMGAALGRPWMQTWISTPEAEEAVKSIMSWFNPALLAISFLHCKNVAMEHTRPDGALAKRFKKRHGFAPTSYHTLAIEPLKAVLRGEGKSDQHGLQKAMHICRGHFADYRKPDGRGLFGKYKKLVWIPQTLRGSKGEKAAPREMEIKI